LQRDAEHLQPVDLQPDRLQDGDVAAIDDVREGIDLLGHRRTPSAATPGKPGAICQPGRGPAAPSRRPAWSGTRTAATASTRVGPPERPARPAGTPPPRRRTRPPAARTSPRTSPAPARAGTSG